MDRKAKQAKKITPGLSRRSSCAGSNSSLTAAQNGKKKEPETGLGKAAASFLKATNLEDSAALGQVENLVDVANNAQGVVILNVMIAILVAALWHTLTVSLYPRQFGSVWVRMCGINETNGTWVGLESPTSLKLKVLAIYIAEDINITTKAPIYGSKRYTYETAQYREAVTGQAPLKPRGGPARGLISNAQNNRRVWTNPTCDVDGDGAAAHIESPPVSSL